MDKHVCYISVCMFVCACTMWVYDIFNSMDVSAEKCEYIYMSSLHPVFSILLSRSFLHLLQVCLHALECADPAHPVLPADEEEHALDGGRGRAPNTAERHRRRETGRLRKKKKKKKRRRRKVERGCLTEGNIDN